MSTSLEMKTFDFLSLIKVLQIIEIDRRNFDYIDHDESNDTQCEIVWLYKRHISFDNASDVISRFIIVAFKLRIKSREREKSRKKLLRRNSK